MIAVYRSEDVVVPFLVRSILQLPSSSHPALLHTSIQLVGNLLDWIQENKVYQDVSIQWLVDKARSPLFVKVASESIENICGKCGKDMIKHFDSLVALIPVFESCQTKGQQMETAILALLRACSSMLNGLSGDEIARYLKALLDPQLQRLSSLLNSNPDLTSNGDHVDRTEGGAAERADTWLRLSSDPVLWIDRIAAVFRFVQPWHDQPANPKNAKADDNSDSSPVPWIDTANHAWLVLSPVCRKYEKNPRVIERCCRTIRFLIRSLGLQSMVFVEQLVSQMVDIYSRHQHSCFLYLASILVDEYGGRDELRPGLVIMLNTLAQESFRLLQRPNGFRDHPDTIDDLFRLGIRFVQRAPSAFFQQDVCVSLFECGIVALDVDHMDANKSTTKFFTECIESLMAANKSKYRDAGVEAAENLFVKYGGQLVSACLRAAIFSVTGSLKRDMAEVIYSLRKLSKEKLSDWLKFALDGLPHDEGLCATTDQLRQFHANVMEAKDLRQMFCEIRDLMKLYI
ncbi:hypothetical protein AB6A40_007160 [Gnathostoma spinigerum]|uniref:Transportin-3 n=1 Tax=Gnathostoma spinigerum TaxID=75299 RepID=A0ABD6EL07_9BILA